MDEASEAEVALVTPAPPASATWAETWTNVGAPALFGLVVGAVWQVQVQPHLAYPLPNPIHAALLLFLLMSPLFHRWLTPHEGSRWKEYLAGVAVLGVFFGGVWTTGFGASYVEVMWRLWFGFGSARLGGDSISPRSAMLCGTRLASTLGRWAAPSWPSTCLVDQDV